MTEAFILNFNEEFLPLTIKHYQQFCDQITIYDNYSTDGSDQKAGSMGCKVVKFGMPGVLSDASYLKVKNYCWKNSLADWVIIVDADEILWHHDLKNILANEKGTIFKTQGYNIFSRETPKDNYLEIITGIPDDSYSKTVIFNPRSIQDMRYAYGAHSCTPSGRIIFSEKELSLLHYRGIGGPDRLIARHGLYRKRMSEVNKKLGLGIHYTYDDERRIKEWEESYAICRELSGLGILF
jgi:hypothetical protein